MIAGSGYPSLAIAIIPTSQVGLPEVGIKPTFMSRYPYQTYSLRLSRQEYRLSGLNHYPSTGGLVLRPLSLLRT